MAILGQTECFCRPISCLQHLRKWGPVDVRVDKQSQHVGITHQIVPKPSQFLPQQSPEPETASLYLTDFAWAWCHQRHQPTDISSPETLILPIPRTSNCHLSPTQGLRQVGVFFAIFLHRMYLFDKCTFKNKHSACPRRLSSWVPLVGHPAGRGN